MGNNGIFLLLDRVDNVFSSKEVAVSECCFTLVRAMGGRGVCVCMCVYYTDIQKHTTFFLRELTYLLEI